MKLSEALESVGRLEPLSVPELRYVQAAADKVRERWPEVDVRRSDSEREALAQKLRGCVERGDWADVRLSFVVTAASAVFDEERRRRSDLARTRDFLYAETKASTSETFLTGVLRAYLESFQPKASHTRALSAALSEARAKMSKATQILLEAVPELFDTVSGPNWLAARMSKMSDPYTELVRLGMRNPHGAGFMDLTHLALTEIVQPHLTEKERIDWYIRWLRPPGKDEGRNTGAEAAIEGLIHPWLEKTPEDGLRSHLVETLIELYGDPRIKSGGVWGGIDDRYMAIVHRWLTREDMRFFTGVVDATQKNAMWPPRRDFWLKLYDEGKIDAAWAALSPSAFAYARRHLMRQDAKNAYTRVAIQGARGNRKDTSLLIMKIGDKIMVDGCHSYRTHVFNVVDPMAPKLFEEGYDCEEIKDASDWGRSGASKGHNSISAWSRWVRDMINADVPFSKRNRPYQRVRRPSPPRPMSRLVPRYQTGRYPSPPQPAYRSRGATSPGNQSSSAGSAAPPARVAAAKREQAQQTSPSISPPWSEKPLQQAPLDNWTDKLVAHGPGAADAVLRYHDEPTDGGARSALSPKAREGLAWVRTVNDELPLRLRNSLEYLFLNMKRNGVDLDALFASASSSGRDDKRPPVAKSPIANVAAPSERFPSLPEQDHERLEVLRLNANELDEIGMWQSSFRQRMASAKAVRKLKDLTEELQAADMEELARLYEKLRAEKNRTET